ncbi:MAG: arsenate reductase (glutaredoxin) [Micavibrio sp.]|nr:arsenate reductase (glutaredoxin) [Micavibrio sp.]HCK32025.1 arsenate reductase (glutaredoxin) [Rhodospirillaceae bacterium]
MTITIYHNPRCSKSRQALALLESKNLDVTIIKYLEMPPSKDDLRVLSKKLGLPISQMIRTKENVYKDLRLKEASEETLYNAVPDNPILLERPIVINGNEAVIARPPEKLEEIL